MAGDTGRTATAGMDLRVTPDRRCRRMPLSSGLDTDCNGVLSVDEIKNAPTSLKRLDKNGDGKISRQELLLLPPRHGPGGGGPGAGGPGAGEPGGGDNGDSGRDSGKMGPGGRQGPPPPPPDEGE